VPVVRDLLPAIHRHDHRRYAIGGLSTADALWIHPARSVRVRSRAMDWESVGTSMARMAAAFILALPIAWNRERAEHSAGLRTFPLVAVAATAYTLLATEIFAGSPDAQARIVQGLITGIGFVGAGAILKHETTVRGTATAASIWSTGALGAACAYNRFDIAFVLSAITFATLRLLTPWKQEGGSSQEG
jgi:putative Mg2+ transporter-C (MgtC) family protein